MSALMEIKDLWGGYTEGVDILRGINMEVQQGETVGIIGLNGSGKSTLGKAIMNMIPYRRGQILFNGEDITGLRTDQLAQRGIAIMQQGGRVFPNLSVWQNSSLAWGDKADKGYYEQLGSIIPLLRKPKKELMRTTADKLSGGQRHELALTMTLLRKPMLVVLDEPSAGLSPKAVEEMYEMLWRIKEHFEITIMVIEQNVKRVVDSCGRYVMMEQGRVSREFDSVNVSEIERTMFLTIGG